MQLEEAIESELALFKQYKEEDLNEGQSTAAELQVQRGCIIEIRVPRSGICPNDKRDSSRHLVSRGS
jgi:hypothetical protein